jgi:two-component system, cell cycle sensor histidine kinase and response regulator CckA
MLVVDDEVQIGSLIIESLGTENLEVVHARDAESALALLEQRKTEPLLVLIDVLMPRMDGLTLARKISTKLRRSKIVIISGHMTDLSWWPADLREVAFLPKPFRMSDLAALLQTARKECAGLA